MTPHPLGCGSSQKASRVTGYTLAYKKLPYLPESISELSGLWYLDIREDCLQQLPKNIGYLRELRILLAGHNQLARLPKSVYDLKNITRFDVRGNPLEEPEKKRLKDVFGERVIF